MLLIPILLPLVWGILALCKCVKPHVALVSGLTALSAIYMALYPPNPLYLGHFPMGITLSLAVDELSIFFSILITVIWTVVARYSTAYFHGDEKQNRFFACFLLALGALMGLCYAHNLITMYLFFEMMSLSLLTTVVHDGTLECLAAGRKYLFYSIGGALLGLVSIFYFYSLDLGTDFTSGGISGLSAAASHEGILWFLLLYVIGFGCKAGLFPLHGWLKTAHPLAPAPASAVLSGVTTKAGIIAIIRGVYYVVGAELVSGSLVQTIVLGLSLVTILLGSTLAYREKVLKTRLAYSTVSQVSYVIFGLFLCNETALLGALLHVIAHALAKNGLFLFAGTVIHETGIKTVDKLGGYGATMGKTFALFTVASLSLVGIPSTAGFTSKWYLVTGAMEWGTLGLVGVTVIMVSALLTAGYLFPITVQAFFNPPQAHKKPVTSGLNPVFFAAATFVVGLCPQLLIPWMRQWVYTLL